MRHKCIVNTKVYGIIGNPVEHTRSPLIHHTLAQALGIDMVYVPFHVKEGQLEAAIKGAYTVFFQPVIDFCCSGN